MVWCCVINCSSHKAQNEAKITYHRFPKIQLLRDIWIKATGRWEWEPTDGSRICSKHFLPNCIQRKGSKNLLVVGSIPTVDVQNVYLPYPTSHSLSSLSEDHLSEQQATSSKTPQNLLPELISLQQTSSATISTQTDDLMTKSSSTQTMSHDESYCVSCVSCAALLPPPAGDGSRKKRKLSKPAIKLL